MKLNYNLFSVIWRFAREFWTNFLCSWQIMMISSKSSFLPNFMYALLCAHFLSRVQLFVTPWTVVHQAPLFMEFPTWEYWSGLPFPSPRKSSQARDWIWVSCGPCCQQLLCQWATWSSILCLGSMIYKDCFQSYLHVFEWNRL